MDVPHDVGNLLRRIIDEETLTASERAAVHAFLCGGGLGMRAYMIVEQPDGTLQVAGIKIDRAAALALAGRVVEELASGA